MRLRSCILALLLVLSGCLDVQLNGPVINARVTVAPLRAPEQVVASGMTRDAQGVIEVIGQARWDKAKPFTRILFLGTADIDVESLDDATLYLVTATGGTDADANRDLLVDENPVPLDAPLRAIMTGRQLKHDTNARVSALTEAVYRWLRPRLDELGDAQVLRLLDRAAAGRVATETASATYDDLLAWNRNNDPAGGFLGDFNALNRFADELANRAGAANLDALAAVVVEGDTDGDGISDGRDPDRDNDGLLNEDDPHPLRRNLRGRFVDAPVRGLGYATESSSGRTAGNGSFDYLEGETARFFIGNLDLGESATEVLVSPLNLFPEAFTLEDQRVTNIARLLQSLDNDCDPANGITIGAAVWQAGLRTRGRLPDSPLDFDGSAPVADLLAASDCTQTLPSSRLAQYNYREGLQTEYARLLDEVGAVSNLGESGEDTLVASDGSLIYARRDPDGEYFADVVYQSGDDSLVFSLNDEGLPFRMASSDGRVVLFDNHTGESVDSYLLQDAPGAAPDYQRVELSPEALAAYTQLRQVAVELPGTVTGASMMRDVFRRLARALVAPARAQDDNNPWAEAYTALFDLASAWDEGRGEGLSDLFQALAQTTVVQAAAQAAALGVSLRKSDEQLLAIINAGGLCAAAELELCRRQLLDRVEPAIALASGVWSALDQAVILDELARRLASADLDNLPPVANIIQPLDGLITGALGPLQVAGQCADAENPSPEQEWRLDGEPLNNLLSGFPISQLTPGDHVLELVCRDADGEETRDTISFRIALPPVVTDFAVPASAMPGEPLALSLRATDAAGVPLREEYIEWYSNLQGFMGTGSSVSYTPQAAGLHVISAYAINEAGLSIPTRGLIDVAVAGEPGNARRTVRYTGISLLAGVAGYPDDGVECSFRITGRAQLQARFELDENRTGSGLVTVSSSPRSTPLNGCAADFDASLDISVEVTVVEGRFALRITDSPTPDSTQLQLLTGVIAEDGDGALALNVARDLRTTDGLTLLQNTAFLATPLPEE